MGSKQNDPNVWYQLGLMSETGVAQKIDLDPARIYYEKVAKAGSTEANVALDRIYQFGVGVPIDRAMAISFYEAAADAGNEFPKK